MGYNVSGFALFIRELIIGLQIRAPVLYTVKLAVKPIRGLNLSSLKTVTYDGTQAAFSTSGLLHPSN